MPKDNIMTWKMFMIHEMKKSSLQKHLWFDLTFVT